MTTTTTEYEIRVDQGNGSMGLQIAVDSLPFAQAQVGPTGTMTGGAVTEVQKDWADPDQDGYQELLATRRADRTPPAEEPEE